MITADYAANTARAFLTAEIAMASANSEAPIVTRTQAEQLLDLYFGLVEQAVPWTENNPLTAGPDSSTATSDRECHVGGHLRGLRLHH